ncbi:hypothetical protein VTI74DRAFT_8768 [Chaetomium olivicolor]
METPTSRMAQPGVSAGSSSVLKAISNHYYFVLSVKSDFQSYFTEQGVCFLRRAVIAPFLCIQIRSSCCSPLAISAPMLPRGRKISCRRDPPSDAAGLRFWSHNWVAHG